MMSKLIHLFVLLLAIAPLLAKPDLEVPDQQEFTASFGGENIVKLLREATLLQGVRVRLEGVWTPEAIKTKNTGESVRIEGDLQRQLQALLSDRKFYRNWVTYCGFDPGLRLSLHHAELGDVDLLVCFRCSEVAVVRNNLRLGGLHFLDKRKLVELIVKAIPDHKDLEEMLAHEEEEAKHQQQVEAQWVAALPKSMRPSWERGDHAALSPDIRPLSVTLKEEYPDSTQRILVLLAWYGSGEGLWSGYPMHETIPAKLLHEFAQKDIVQAVKGKPLNTTQIAGFARFVVMDSYLAEQKAIDPKSLPSELKEAIWKHVEETKDPFKIKNAKSSFSE